MKKAPVLLVALILCGVFVIAFPLVQPKKADYSPRPTDTASQPKKQQPQVNRQAEKPTVEVPEVTPYKAEGVYIGRIGNDFVEVNLEDKTVTMMLDEEVKSYLNVNNDEFKNGDNILFGYRKNGEQLYVTWIIKQHQ